MDTTVHLDRVERDDTDISFQLSFGKARERMPATRDDFRKLNVYLIGDEWQYEIDQVAPKKTAKGDTGLRSALLDALAGHGEEYRIPKGPTVRAVDVEHVRREFVSRYIVDPDLKDPDAARRMAFNRALKAAQRTKQIGCQTKGKKQLVWLVNEGKNDTGRA